MVIYYFFSYFLWRLNYLVVVIAIVLFSLIIYSGLISSLLKRRWLFRYRKPTHNDWEIKRHLSQYALYADRIYTPSVSVPLLHNSVNQSKLGWTDGKFIPVHLKIILHTYKACFTPFPEAVDWQITLTCTCMDSIGVWITQLLPAQTTRIHAAIPGPVTKNRWFEKISLR